MMWDRTPQRCPRKKTLLRLALFLLAGAIINVALAWGLSIWSTARYDEAALRACESWDVDEYNRKEAVKVCLAYGSWNLGRATVSGVTWHQIVSTKTPQSYLEDCGGYHIHIAGWPMSSLYCVGTFESPPQIINAFVVQQCTWSGGMRCPSMLQPKFTSHYLLASIERPLPLSPVFTGFALNTIFYAAILWLLFIAPGKLRRRMRIKRGLCPACKYPVGTSAVCTECSAPVGVKNP